MRATLAAFVVVITGITVWAQLPIPVPGQTPTLNNGPQPGARGQRGGQGQRGQFPVQPQPAAPVVVAPLATATPEITGPGKFFETLMQLKPTDDLAHFG